MRITRKHIENLKKGIEIDFTMTYRDEKHGRDIARVSLRYKDGKFQVYAKWVLRKDEEILFEHEDIRKCIEYTNNLFGYNDTVEENIYTDK